MHDPHGSAHVYVGKLDYNVWGNMSVAVVFEAVTEA